MAGAAAIVLGGCTTMTDEAPATASQTDSEAPAANAAVTVPDNILLAEWTGPFDGVPPFDQVRPDLFPQAFEFAIDERRREVLAIANNPAAPPFDSTNQSPVGRFVSLSVTKRW